MTETEDYSQAATPTAHHTTHENGGSDEITVEGLAGQLAETQPTEWAKIADPSSEYPPDAHASKHQNGGDDEISVAGLSGELADAQPSTWAKVAGKPSTFAPSAHNATHDKGGADALSSVLWKDGTQPLTSDWDIGEGRHIKADKIRAREEGGIALYDDDDNGLFVNDGGIVDMVKQSRARYYLSNQQSIPAAAWTKIVFDTEVYDAQNEFSTSTNRFTALKAGAYLVILSCRFINITDVKQFGVLVAINGSPAGAFPYIAAGATAPHIINGSDVFELSANDYLEFRATHTDVDARLIGNDSHDTYFAVSKIG